MVKVQDPYRFLEDPDSDATKKWVEAQNVITKSFMDSCETLEPLKQKLTQFWNYPKMGCPEKRGDHYYFKYNTGLQNQFVMYKIKAQNTVKVSKENPLEGTDVLIDPNTLAEDGTASLGTQVWSENGKYMAYQVQRSGSDWATIYVKDSETIQDLPDDELKWVKFSGMSWTKGNEGFFYSKYDAPAAKGDSMDKAGQETDKL